MLSQLLWYTRETDPALAVSARRARPAAHIQRSQVNAEMAENIALNPSQVLAAKRWMEDEQGMERACLSPAEYVAYRMRVSPAEAQALVAAVYAQDEDN